MNPLDLKSQIDRYNKLLSPQPTIADPLDRFITSDPEMLELKIKVSKLRSSNLNVLIIGETGTGKELIATSLHSTRKGKFVAVDCSAFNRELLESELFGTVKGAYTGCLNDRMGLFEYAKDGTLFLDEIGNMPMFLQSKLLRVIENLEIRRLGSNESIRINCRIVAATNNLTIPNDTFREDLYYRLKGSELVTKPLRERRKDIRLIAQYYDTDKVISPDILEDWEYKSEKFKFKGNARELKNMVREQCELR